MENLKIIGNSILNIGENGDVLAVAYIVPFNNIDLMNKIDNLIQQEIKDVRYFDGDENMTDEEILEEFNYQFESFYEFKKKYKDLNNIIYLDLIENKGIKKGSALTILNYLKKQYEGILLFSVEEATTYWENNGFINVLNDSFYFFTKEVLY